MEKLRIYRFQKNNFYGGVATAFCGECNLNCIYCYSQKYRNTGKYYTPREIADKLIKIANRHNLEYCRISGGDPFIKFQELLKIIEIIIDETDLTMILETNGIEIGENPEIAKKLSNFSKDRMLVRLCIKHVNPVKYEKLCQIDGKLGYENSIRALNYLKQYAINTTVAYMEDWFSDDEFIWFVNNIRRIRIYRFFR